MRSANPSQRTVPFGFGRRVCGQVIAASIVALIALLFVAILAVPVDGPADTGPLDIAHLLRMTIVQAGLTTVFSLTVGVGLAWALNRLHFPGRAAHIRSHDRFRSEIDELKEHLLRQMAETENVRKQGLQLVEDAAVEAIQIGHFSH